MTDAVARFFDGYPPHIAAIGQRVRAIVRAELADASEYVYQGWRLIGYRVPKYVCFIAPHEFEVRLGFEYGVSMRDPHGILQGGGTQVRYLAYRDVLEVEEEIVRAYIREAVAVANLPRELRPMLGAGAVHRP